MEAAMKKRDIHIGLIVPLDGLPLIVGRVYDPNLIRRALREARRSAERRVRCEDPARRDLDARLGGTHGGPLM
jgi:hypothetical protein